MIDPLTFRTVIAGIILLALGSLAAATVLEVNGHDAGPAWALGGSALTGLVGLLVNPRTGPDPTVQIAADAAESAGYEQARSEVLEVAVAEAEAAARPKPRPRAAGKG